MCCAVLACIPTFSLVDAKALPCTTSGITKQSLTTSRQFPTSHRTSTSAGQTRRVSFHTLVVELTGELMVLVMTSSLTDSTDLTCGQVMTITASCAKFLAISQWANQPANQHWHIWMWVLQIQTPPK